MLQARMILAGMQSVVTGNGPRSFAGIIERVGWIGC